MKSKILYIAALASLVLSGCSPPSLFPPFTYHISGKVFNNPEDHEKVKNDSIYLEFYDYMVIPLTEAIAAPILIKRVPLTDGTFDFDYPEGLGNFITVYVVCHGNPGEHTICIDGDSTHTEHSALYNGGQGQNCLGTFYYEGPRSFKNLKLYLSDREFVIYG